MISTVRALCFAAALLIGAVAAKELGLSDQAGFMIMTGIIATFVATGGRPCAKGC